MIMQLSEVLGTVEHRIQILRKEFQMATLLGKHELFLNGALKTGLYTGPKSKKLSLNQNCPYDYVIEADLRLVLPEDKDPHDPRVLSYISEVFEPQSPPVITHTYHWNRTDIPTSRFYNYQCIDANLGFEWELAVCRQPYVDIALFWQDLFSPEEIEWQKGLRATVYRLPNSLDEEYTSFKNKQNTEARWRLVALKSLEDLAHRGKLIDDLSLPKTIPIGEPVITMVQKWLAGETGYRTMERPLEFLTPRIKEELRKYFPDINVQSLGSPPPEPFWVTYASDIQQSLKARKTGNNTSWSPDCIP